MEIQLLISAKEQAVYSPDSTVTEIRDGVNMPITDPELRKNAAVSAALNHAGTLIRARMENPHIEKISINLHFH